MALLGSLTNDSSFDDVAEAIIKEAVRRDYPRGDTLAVTSTGIQESRLNPRAVSPNGLWVGIFQQDASYEGRWDPNANIREFFNRLDAKRRSSGASSDVWKNIFWLQQRPGELSADAAYANGRKDYLTEIKRHVTQAGQLYDRFAGTGSQVGWNGDPVWLLDVLQARPLLKGKVRALDGWDQRGHGDFADVWGVMWHHTGNGRATAESIRDGRPDLPGPVSNIHIAQDGTVTVVAVGVCWHAGNGSGFGLPTNNVNNRLIGVECAWPMDTSLTPATQHRERWPDAQIVSMREVGAAITLKLGYDASRNITHKEWAGAAQGKWDPGNLDPDWFRGEIGKSMRGVFDPKPTVPVPVPVDYAKESWDQLRIEWAQLGGQTLVNALGEVRDKVLGVDDYARWKAGL